MERGFRVDWSLYLVADFDFCAGRDLVALTERAVEGGVTVVQLRAKSLGSHELFTLASRMAEALRSRAVPLIINDRADIAAACGADGVHLGQDDLPPSAARRLVGGKGIIGVSVNTVEEACAAERAGADYVGLGPAFATATKDTDLPVLGPDGMREVRPRVAIPVIAIGGIHAGNAAAIMAAGADGIAVVSAILGADDARRAAAGLRAAIRAGKGQ